MIKGRVYNWYRYNRKRFKIIRLISNHIRIQKNETTDNFAKEITSEIRDKRIKGFPEISSEIRKLYIERKCMRKARKN